MTALGREARQRLSSSARLLAAGSIAAGAIVLAGWALDVAVLRAPFPGLIEMKANTAIAFALAGTALLILTLDHLGPWPRRAAGACAIAAGAIGVLALIEHVAGAPLGVGELLFRDPPDSASDVTTQPGALAPQTAVGFVFVSLGLLAMNMGTRWNRIAEAGLVATLLLSLFAVLGYVYDTERLSTIGAFNPMALHTALAFGLLATGALCAQPDLPIVRLFAGAGAGSGVARRVIPVALIGLPAAGWLRLEGERAGYYQSDVGVAILVVAFVLILLVGVVTAGRRLNRLERQRTEAASVRDHLGQIVEQSGDAIQSASPDGVLTSWNGGAEQLYGYSSAEALAHPETMLVPERLAEDHRALVRTVMEGNQVRGYDTQRVRRDGELIEVSLSASPVRGAGGEVTGVSMIARDITEQVHARTAATEAAALADGANRAKSEFLSRMSHELRTPLTVVLGFGQLLQAAELEPRQAENVRQIVSAGQHLLGLINELLDISRLESNTMEISIEPVHVGTALEDALALVEPLSHERDISLIPPAEADLHVLADLQRLKQVLLNLLSNAIKYNRAGGSVTLAVQPVRSDRIRILVRDTGHGMTAEDLGKVFQPFERLEAGARGIEGTGLGLMLAKTLVEAMGGEIAVESEVGVGTTFSVELERAGAVHTAPAANGGRPALADRPPLPPCSILYVEDNPANTRLLEQTLETQPDVSLLTATCGLDGIDLAFEHRPDLVLLDLHLPDIDGDVVLERLRRDPRTARLPVVMLSADATPRQARRLRAKGADEYLTKPIDIPRLLEVIRLSLGAPAGAR